MSNFKFLVLSAFAAILLSACDSGSSSDPVSDPISEVDISVQFFDDLVSCNSKREGVTAYVKEEKKLYVCKEGDWANSLTEVKGLFTDARDGQVYKTVKIGSQTWMAENLNYGDSVQTPNLKGATWCGGGDLQNEGDCSVYGRLYTRPAAVNKSGDECSFGNMCNLSAPVQGICPDGWHLPDTTEFKKLVKAVGGEDVAGTMLKSTSGWLDDYGEYGNGLDSYGFAALPAGLRRSDGYYNGVGFWAYFWSSSEEDIYESRSLYLFYKTAEAVSISKHKDFALSIRCLKDN